MLSATTPSSATSDSFASTAASTPLTPYSASTPSKTSNPLTELIDAENSYIDTLKTIDTELAPVCRQQPADFLALVNYARDILKVNKRFCAKLVKIAANPQTIKELGDVLMHWIDDMEVPYANFSRGYINNLNQRQDILEPPLRQLLQKLSAQASYDITLESLFNAPLQQLKYYKMLYGRLMDSAEPGRADHKLLVKANQRIDTVLLMAQRNNTNTTVSASSQHHHHYKALPSVTPIQTKSMPPAPPRDPNLAAFIKQLDCSRTVDLFTGSSMQFDVSLATQDAAIVLRDSFVLLPEDTHLTTPTRVHLILTHQVLMIASENAGHEQLLFPALQAKDITVQSKQLDRELVGEYLIQFSVLGKKHLTMRADSKEARNTWVGVDVSASSSSTLTPRSLKDVIHAKLGLPQAPPPPTTPATAPTQRQPQPQPSLSTGTSASDKNRKSMIRKSDFFSYYTDQTGEISPLSSDDEDEPPFKSTTSTTTLNKPAPPPKSNEKHELSGGKSLPPTPQTQPPPPAPVKTRGLLTPHNGQTTGRSPSPAPSIASEESNTSGGGNSPARPVSPRTIEINHVVAPVAMQAVTQNIERIPPEGISKPLPHPQQQPAQQQPPVQQQQASVSRPPLPQAAPVTPTRSSSFRQQQQQQQQLPYQPPTLQKSLPQQPPYARAPSPGPGAAGYRPGMAGGTPLPSGSAGPLPMMGGPSMGARPPAPPPSQQPQYHPQPQYPRQNPPPQPRSIGTAGGHYLNVANVSPRLTPHRSMDDLQSPPRSPTPSMAGQPNAIKQVVYNNAQCEVFHWKSESWYAVDGQCLLQVRQTHSNRACVAIQIQNTGHMYLNAWILPNTVISHASPTDVSLSVSMGLRKENYLIHLASPAEAATLFTILQRMHHEAVQMYQQQQQQQVLATPPIVDEPADPVEEVQDLTKVPQTLRLVMQCKTKLFVQNEHSNWSSFGSVTLKISQQSPSKRMHIEMENGKTKLVSSTVQSRNVSRMNTKRITFLLLNEQERTSMVYMIQIKEEQTANKIVEYLKTKNEENGW